MFPVLVIRIEHLETMAIVTIETSICREPEESQPVLDHPVYETLGKALLHGNVFEGGGIGVGSPMPTGLPRYRIH
jgi:hypothetical protein